jgi:hypothetical protein
MALPASSPWHLEPSLEEVEAPVETARRPAKMGTEASHILSIPANVRANNPTGDQGSVSQAADTQSETGLAVRGNDVVVAWNDSKGLRNLPPPNPTLTTISSFAYSTNGGTSFTDGGNVPLLTPTDQPFGDCTLGVDASGNFYMACIYVGSTQDVAVYRGTFTGSSFAWQPPVMAASGVGGALDKPYLTVDPANGNVYVSYTRFVGGTARIEVVRGLALGTSWNAPVVLETSGVQGSRPIVGPEGNLYVAWESGWGQINCNLSSTTGAIHLRRSTSPAGAMSFDAVVTVGTVNHNWTSYWAGNLRGNGLEFPDLAVDRSGGPNNGIVYCIWNEATPWSAAAASGTTTETDPNDGPSDAGVRTLSPGDDCTGSISASGDFDYWKLSVTAGQHVLVRLEPEGFVCGVSSPLGRNFSLRFYKGVNGTAGDSILANSNLNGFASQVVFDAPETATYFFRVRNLNTSGTVTGLYTVRTRLLNYGIPSPARDMRDIVVARSTNQGVSFQAEVRVNDSPIGLDEEIPALAADPTGAVWAFWYDVRDAAGARVLRSYYRSVSLNGGTTWKPNRRVSNELMYFNLNTVAVPNYGEYNQAAAGNSKMYTVWSDERLSHAAMGGSGVDVYVASLPQGGTTSDLEHLPVSPRALALRAGEPNPFNPATRLVFDLPSVSKAALDVYTVDGRHVRTLVREERLEPGQYAKTWDGTDDAGIRLASGVYVARLQAGLEQRSQQLVLVK